NCSGVMPFCWAASAWTFFKSKSSVTSSPPTGKLFTWSSCLPSWVRVTLYLPISMPREKYSPFLLVFRLYFRPLSVLTHSRLAPAIGFPSISLQTPFTVPVAWANTGGTHSAATATTSINISKRCFMFLASRLIKLIDIEYRKHRHSGPAQLSSFRQLRVWNRGRAARIPESSQAQNAAVANAAGAVLPAVARPSEIEGRAQFKAPPYDFRLTQLDQRRNNFYPPIFCAQLYHLIERL